jgi:hypothetical protein
MKHRKIIIGPSNLNSLKEIQSFIDDCDQYEDIDLFLDGDGGYTACMQILEKYLNSRKDDINIFLQWRVQSSHASLVLLRCTNKVFIYPDFEYAMFHLFDSEEYSRRHYADAKYSTTDLMNFLEADKLSVWLPEKKIKKFNKGKDLFLSRKEIQKYFHEKKNIYFL